MIDELIRHKPMQLSEARAHLAQYLFRSDDVFKQVSMLSGGERGKLALAILALNGANFLLLDEPTNHLDIPAQEVLQEVLEQFDGTILLVSHDRYLIDRLATQIWHLEDGVLRIFKGNYQEFLAAENRRLDDPEPVKVAKLPRLRRNPRQKKQRPKRRRKAKRSASWKRRFTASKRRSRNSIACFSTPAPPRRSARSSSWGSSTPLSRARWRL